jgi:S-adenosylmethionine/arginine decarboxylase-like enzyme
MLASGNARFLRFPFTRACRPNRRPGPATSPDEREVAIWGQHLILDMYDCDRAAVRNPDTIRAFSRDLVDAVGMKAFGAPVLEHFAEHDPAAGGYTLVQLVETSHISAHFAENTGDIYLDVFACKTFSEEAAVEVSKRYFRPRAISKTSLQRGVERFIVSDAA